MEGEGHRVREEIPRDDVATGTCQTLALLDAVLISVVTKLDSPRPRSTETKYSKIEPPLKTPTKSRKGVVTCNDERCAPLN